MKCMDCDNKREFYELSNVADTYYFLPNGELDYVDSGEHAFEGFECAKCGSRDVRENK